jgi:hypothetical protein
VTRTRAELVRVARDGDPWTVIDAFRPVMTDYADDPGIRFLAARALAGVGLGELASSQIEHVGGAALRTPAMTDLRTRIRGLSSSRVDLASRVETASRAAAVLGSAHPCVAEALPGWIDAERDVHQFRASDGNVVRLSAEDIAAGWLWGIEDRIDQSRGIARRLDPLDTEFGAPITVESGDNPWVVVRLAQGMPRHAGGFWRRLRLVEPDARALLSACAACPDLITALSEERTELFVGPDAGEVLSRRLRERSAYIVTGPTVGAPTAAEAARRVAEIRREQSMELERLRSVVGRRDADMSTADWAARFRERGGGGLRVLIPTCRFSTYIQHSSRLLAAAFERAGHTAELVIEPDDSTNLANLTYLSACERLDPDLIVMINYPRCTRASVLPTGVPFVCWMQDNMPHFQNREVGLGQGERDFLVGHAGHELFRRFGFPVERAMSSPVVTDPEVFHDGEVPAELEAEHACEIAYVSHQSGTFDALLRRFADEASEAGLSDVIMGLEGPIGRAVDEISETPIVPALRDAVRAAIERSARRPDDEAVSQMLHQAALPLAERLVRHRTLAWAADLVERRGWSLRIYGNGWDAHPELARFAAGPLEHGEPLRASYRGATVHLHPTVRALSHQRVMECALSGGFPIGTRYASILPNDLRLAVRLGLDVTMGEPSADGRSCDFVRADHEGLLRDAALRQRLGEPVSDRIVVDRASLERVRATPVPEGTGQTDPTALFPDVAAYTYGSRAEFDALVTRAVEDPAFRGAWSRALAERVRAGFTTDSLARRIVEFVSRGLTGAAGGGRADPDQAPVSSAATGVVNAA